MISIRQKHYCKIVLEKITSTQWNEDIKNTLLETRERDDDAICLNAMLSYTCRTRYRKSYSFDDDDDYRVEAGFGFLQAMSFLLFDSHLLFNSHLLFDSHLLFKKVMFNLQSTGRSDKICKVCEAFAYYYLLR